MKVLWLTSSPGGASTYLNLNIPGRGWISSLESFVKSQNGIDLAVCFFNNDITEFKFTHHNVTYYPVKDRLSSFMGKIVTKALGKLWDTNPDAILKVLADFRPDIIQLFGTETGMGEIVTYTEVPIIAHIQGLINPCLLAWLPKGISLNKILFNSALSDVILKRDLVSDYKILKKKSIREEIIIKKLRYCFGRTNYDKAIMKMYNSDIEYFHCEEVLRPFIYGGQWNVRENELMTFVTTINPQMYKGLDIVLETAQLLKEKLKLKFRWNIIGIDNNDKIVKVIEKIKRKRFKDYFVYFKGIKTSDNLIEELLRSDLFIHPSHIDNSPNSVCEAMLLGMPVIAGNVGGVSSIINNNVNGFLYNSQDPFELAMLIIQKIKDKSELERISENARNTALKRHNVESIVAKVFETYEHIITSNNKILSRYHNSNPITTS